MIVASDLGDIIRRHREAKGLSQIALAKAAKMRNERLSAVELGHNVHSKWPAKIAKALGFKGIVEMVVTVPNDKVMPQLWKLWPNLSEQARMDVLRSASDAFVAIKE